MGKLRVLIADDEEGVRESLRLILSVDDDILSVPDGEQAMEAVNRQGPFDLILLDIKMPKRDGLDVLRQVKAKGLSTPIVMLTAYQSVELAKEAVKLGASDYVVKPFSREQVLSAVRGALSAHS